MKVTGLDTLDGTPVLDIKPYYPPWDKPKGDLLVPDYIYRLKY